MAYTQIGSRTMARLLWLSFCAATSACGLTNTSGADQTTLPRSLVVKQGGAVWLDGLLARATRLSDQALPGAQLSYFAYRGACEDLPSLRGDIQLAYAKVDETVTTRRIMISHAFMSLPDNEITIEVKDETDMYPNDVALETSGKKIRTVVESLIGFFSRQTLCEHGSSLYFDRVGSQNLWQSCLSAPGDAYVCVQVNDDTGEVLPAN